MDLWGEDFEKLYCKLEAEGKGRTTVKAQQLWFRILEAQMETGMPYMLYKDHANRKSNQQNLGTIHCSNLCTEIIEPCLYKHVFVFLNKMSSKDVLKACLYKHVF